MITFSSPEFKERFKHALSVWHGRIHDEIYEEIPHPQDWDEPEEEDGHFSESTKFNVFIRYWDDSEEVTCQEFIELVEEFEKSRFVESTGCISHKRVLWRVAPLSQNAHSLLGSLDIIPEDETHTQLIKELPLLRKQTNDLRRELGTLDHPLTDDQQQKFKDWQDLETRKSEVVSKISRPLVRRCQTEGNWDGRPFKVSIASGLTPFALHVVDKKLDHEYFPSMDHEEAFVEIAFDSALADAHIKAIVQSYLFELSASYGAEFCISPRLDQSDFVFDEDDPDDTPEGSEPSSGFLRLRPLATGSGIYELLSIYNRGIGTNDNELRILCFTKVIEFVAQTVVRRQSTELIRGKLMSARAIAPDSQYIAELEALIEQQRAYKKDRESIRLAILQCCNAVELSLVSPAIIKELSTPSLVEDPKSQANGLARFADVLYSTRNVIAHAKANYSATGDECPEDQMPQLAICARIAAEQAIRWFQGVPDPIRVV